MSTPQVAILMGSNSDRDIMKPAVDMQEKFGIPYEAKVISAHRATDMLIDYVTGLRERGFGAGHLAGVTAAKTHRPGLILMDIRLPDFDGYEATRRIRANPDLRSIPIIAVTSYALSGDDAKAFEAGCDAYVSKPFSPRALLTKIREFLP